MSEEPTVEQLYERYLEAKKAYWDAHYKSLVRANIFQDLKESIPEKTGNTLKLFMYVPLTAEVSYGEVWKKPDDN